MEYVFAICGGAFIFFILWVILGSNDLQIPNSELDDMTIEQMKSAGYTEDEIDEILWRNKGAR